MGRSAGFYFHGFPPNFLDLLRVALSYFEFLATFLSLLRLFPPVNPGLERPAL